MKGGVVELLATTDVHIKDVFDGPVEVKLWTKADPFPDLGNCVGVDTETELITPAPTPPDTNHQPRDAGISLHRAFFRRPI